MRNQLSGAAFERIPAVDGSNEPQTAKGLTRFELACLESHKTAWRQFLNGPGDCACFLEDDLHIWPGFAALTESGSWIPSDAHSIKLDTYLQKVEARGQTDCDRGARSRQTLFTPPEQRSLHPHPGRSGALSRLDRQRPAAGRLRAVPHSFPPPGLAHLSTVSRDRDPGSPSRAAPGRSDVRNSDGGYRWKRRTATFNDV